MFLIYLMIITIKVEMGENKMGAKIFLYIVYMYVLIDVNFIVFIIGKFNKL